MNIVNWYKKSEQTFLRLSLYKVINNLSILPKINNIVQLGALKLDNSIMPKFGELKPVIISTKLTENVNILSVEEHLPLQSKSVDLLIVLHSFEVCNNPHALIREIHRVVKDDGYVLLSGFNVKFPFSLFVVFKMKIKRILTMNKSDDWFAVLGFSKKQCFFSFKSPFLDRIFNNKMKKINNQFFHFGRVYSCLYQKRVIPLTFDASMWKQNVKITTPTLVETRNYD